MGIIDRALANLKSAVPLPGGFATGPVFWGWSQSGLSHIGLPFERDYSNDVGDGSRSSLVAATVGWIARQFPEAAPILTRDTEDGIDEVVPSAPAAQLLRRPTWDARIRRSFYSGALLRSALVTSYWIDGNAYALKVRDRALRVVQLWYVPHWMMEPRTRPDGGGGFVDHYLYRPFPGTLVKLDPAEVWHVRHGIDPDFPLRGWSPIKTVLREVYTDEQAARFTAAMLRNRGMPGVIIAPRFDSKRSIPPEERDAIKLKFVQTFGGDNVGSPLVVGQPTEIKDFGWSPEKLMLGDLRDVPEERVTAVTGIPAVVVGFGTGLQGSKVGATLREFREQAWENNLIPTLKLFAEEYDGQVLPEFLGDTDLETHSIAFDLSDVGALQDLMLKKTEVQARAVSSGIVRRREARARLGYRSGPEDDVYLPQPGVQGGPSSSTGQSSGETPAAIVEGD